MFHRRHWPYTTLAAALAAWTATLTAAPATCQKYQQQLRDLLAETDLARLRAADLPVLAARIVARWPGRGTRNRARTALRGFLCWGCPQGLGQRGLTPDVIMDALPLEARSSAASSPSLRVSFPMLHLLFPTLPQRTRALLALHLALAMPPAALVVLRLGDVTLPLRGLIIHLPAGDRELVGPAISEARAYVKLRLKLSGGDLAAPLFEGCTGCAISPSYARKLLHSVAVAAGMTGSLLGAVHQQGGGLGGW
ncbi:MAG: hypothetical protein H0X24_02020 [Ktedonobacterales bacterium]|nr:hypothetical protein [Ktedonobacterales bacterium]